MIIAIDLDDVLSETTASIIKYHNSRYGTTLKIEDFYCYDWNKIWGGTWEEAMQKWHDFTQTDEFQNLPTVTGASDAIKKLSKENKLIIVTSRLEHLEKDTVKWIDKFFPQIFKDIYVNKHASSGTTRYTKSEICKKINATILIEDNLEYAKDCCSNNIEVLLFNRPWNQNKIPNKSTRVFSWKDIQNTISQR